MRANNNNTPVVLNCKSTTTSLHTNYTQEADKKAQTVLGSARNSSPADIANVVEGISWNKCFSHLQWYKHDIRFPIDASAADESSDVSSAKAFLSPSLRLLSPVVHGLQYSGAGAACQFGQELDAFSSAVSCVTEDTCEERMGRAFADISVSEVVWLITYISKAVAYTRVEIWAWQSLPIPGSVPTPPTRAVRSMLSALKSVIRDSHDLRLISDVARFVSCRCKGGGGQAKHWRSGELNESMGSIYAHLSCR
jgi:hypothetical protein